MGVTAAGNGTSEKETFVHGVFTAIAHRYDLLNTVLSFNQDKYWRQTAVSHARLPRGGTALDVCCGTGLLTLALAKKAGETGRIVGLDFCENMLSKARANIAKTPFGRTIELIYGNAMQLPFADNSFDCVTNAFALRNVPDILKVLAEMRRVVKPGGNVVVLELAKPTVPVFKQLYYLYFERLLPLLGKMGIGQDGPYRWLPESLRRFPHQREICAMLSQVGLKDAHYYELTGGIAAVYVGMK